MGGLGALGRIQGQQGLGASGVHMEIGGQVGD